MHELSDEGASPHSSTAAPSSSLPYGEAAYGEAAEAADGGSPLGGTPPSTCFGGGATRASRPSLQYPSFAASPGSLPTQAGFQARPSLTMPLAPLDRPSPFPSPHDPRISCPITTGDG